MQTIAGCTHDKTWDQDIGLSSSGSSHTYCESVLQCVLVWVLSSLDCFGKYSCVLYFWNESLPLLFFALFALGPLLLLIYEFFILRLILVLFAWLTEGLTLLTSLMMSMKEETCIDRITLDSNALSSCICLPLFHLFTLLFLEIGLDSNRRHLVLCKSLHRN